MELGSAALTGLFVGMGWALVRVVEYFVKKYRDEKVSLNDDQTKKLNEIYSTCLSLGKYGTLTHEQERSLNEIKKNVAHLDELHSVYDDNHVPKWYVPKDTLSLVRSIHNNVKTINEEFEDELNKISAGQSVLVEKMSDLINSQKLVTERIGDLIILWSKITKQSNGG
jgi:hypothetical protein